MMHPTTWRHVKPFGILLLALEFYASARAETTLRVSPNGVGDGPGTTDKPLSLPAALQHATKDTSVTEIILAGGEYQGLFSIGGPKDADLSKPPTLTIRAADGQKPVLRYALRLDQAEAVEGIPGLYRTKQIPPTDPQLWERDTRMRYKALSNKASVGAFPASCFVDREEGALYFRTSDAKPPKEHQLFLALCPNNSRLLAVYRPNTIVDGITFCDTVGENTTAIQSYAEHFTISHCKFDNVNVGWAVDRGGKNSVMEECSGIDVAQPVISYDADVAVRNCRFVKQRDTFLFDVIDQNDCAYQVYSPGHGGTFVGNFAKGYHLGILIKAGKGRYVIRHNTIVDTEKGIDWTTGNQDSDTSYNLIVNANDFIRCDHFAPTFKLDYNLYWNPINPTAFANRVEIVRGADRGKFDRLVDPRFVDPANGDYRLLPDSPALQMKDAEGRPVGAFDSAPAEAAAKSKPTISLAFGADTRAAGRTGKLTFDRDSWIGGGTTFIRDLAGEGVTRRITGSTTVTVRVRAFDTSGRITKMRYLVADQATQETNFEPVFDLKLPDKDGEHRIRFEAQNDRGIWSEPAEAILRLDRHAPKIIGSPTIVANDNGRIVTFRTDETCFAEVQCNGEIVQTAALTKRFWDPNDGGEWIERWNIARTDHALAILKPKVKTGEKAKLRIVLRDEAGFQCESDEITATAKGPTRSLYVATGGEDSIERGSKDKPFRTLQYGADRALPGDHISLAPGVYTGSTFLTHGGVNEKTPLVIEAEKPGTVTLDAAKRENAVIHLEGAPFVTIRNLRVLFFKAAGIYAYRSPHTTVEGCTFYNGSGWTSTPGYQVFCFWSPNAHVTRCLAIGGYVGFFFLESPQATVTHNTCSQQMFAAASYAFSAAGSVQRNNSFSFGGNDVYSLEWHHPDELKTFDSDFNNLGSNITEYNRGVEQSDPALWKLMKAEEFKVDYDPARFRTSSKAVIGTRGGSKRYFSLKQWRDETGLEKHSIFDDPQYVKPYLPIDSWDWSVKADSPNLKAGENGALIGALGVQTNQVRSWTKN